VTRQHRHNAILHRLAKAVPAIAGVVRVDRQVPGADSTLRPDLVVMDQAARRLTIIDVAVAFENRYEALERIRAEKIRKYSAIANHFRMRHWQVELDAVVIGALGSWDPANERALRTLRISPRYAKMMRRFIVSDTIRWSRDIYIEHVSGRRQYVVPEPPVDVVAAINPQDLYPAPQVHHQDLADDPVPHAPEIPHEAALQQPAIPQEADHPPLEVLHEADLLPEIPDEADLLQADGLPHEAEIPPEWEPPHEAGLPHRTVPTPHPPPDGPPAMMGLSPSLFE